MIDTTKTISPSELAKRWKIKNTKVLAWIRSGELAAFDVSNAPGIGRPRFRITADAISDFQRKRSGAIVKPVRRTRRPKTTEKIIQYF